MDVRTLSGSTPASDAALSAMLGPDISDIGPPLGTSPLDGLSFGGSFDAGEPFLGIDPTDTEPSLVGRARSRVGGDVCVVLSPTPTRALPMLGVSSHTVCASLAVRSLLGAALLRRDEHGRNSGAPRHDRRTWVFVWLLPWCRVRGHVSHHGAATPAPTPAPTPRPAQTNAQARHACRGCRGARGHCRRSWPRPGRLRHRRLPHGLPTHGGGGPRRRCRARGPHQHHRSPPASGVVSGAGEGRSATQSRQGQDPARPGQRCTRQGSCPRVQE